VILNLIKNALKFTRSGRIDLRAYFDYDASHLCVAVRDTGIGIKQEDLGKLFSMFGKLQRTASMNSEGIGLGLQICKQLVEQNGGQIKVTMEAIRDESVNWDAVSNSLFSQDGDSDGPIEI
jgi:signal transduction histidine kinase